MGGQGQQHRIDRAQEPISLPEQRRAGTTHWAATGLIGGPRLFREMINALVCEKHDLEVRWQVETSAQIPDASRVDWLLLIQLPVKEAMATVLSYRGLNPDVKVVAFVQRAIDLKNWVPLELTNIAYLPMSATISEVSTAFTAILRGEAHLHSHLASQLLCRGITLTHCEHKVLGAVSKGLSSSQAARALNVSENTLKTHLSNLYRKLGARGRTQAVLEAIRQGLISPPSERGYSVR